MIQMKAAISLVIFEDLNQIDVSVKSLVSNVNDLRELLWCLHPPVLICKSLANILERLFIVDISHGWRILGLSHEVVGRSLILTRPLLIVEGLLFDDHLLAIASIFLASSEDGGKTSTRSCTSSDMSGSFRSTIRGILFQYWLIALVVDGRASRDHRVADLAQTYR
jgi:hypothetical protein